MTPDAPKPDDAGGAIRLAPNPYGYYDPEAREYVITRPDTPAPWLNYLGQGRYGGIISNTAGGFSFDRDPWDRRVSRYRYNSLPPDQPGRYVYLRRKDTGEYWGATWQPVRAALDSYECRHGAGYTKIATERKGTWAEVLYFVPPTPPDDPCPAELWVLRLANRSEKAQVIQVFSYLELSFTDASNDLLNLDWSQHVVSSRYDETLNAIVTGTKFSPTRQFFSSDRPALGYDSDREAFVGRYRGLEDPEAVIAGKPTGSEASRGNNIGSLFHEVPLEPGEEARIVYVLGVTDTPAAISAVTKRYRDPARVELALDSLRSDWEEYFSAFRAETPDSDTTAMLELLEPAAMSRNALLVAFCFGLRDRSRSRDRYSRHCTGHARGRPCCPGRSCRPIGAVVGSAVRRRALLAPVLPLERQGRARSGRRTTHLAPVVF